MCVCVHGVYDPELSDVLIFPCPSVCLRPPTDLLPLLQRQLMVNLHAVRHQLSVHARTNNESGRPQRHALEFL